MIEVVVGEPGGQRVQRRQRFIGSAQLGDRQRPVERHHRSGCELKEAVVECHHLPPIGPGIARRGGVAGHDGGLQLVWTDAPHAQCSLQQLVRIRDRVMVPGAPILLGKQDERTIRGESRVRTGKMQPHHGQEADRLRLIRHQANQQ